MSRWLDDLDYLLDEIAQIHPNPYHEYPASHWDEVLDDVRQQLRQLPSPFQLTQLYRVIALLADSHSRINLRFGHDHQGMELDLPDKFGHHYGFDCYAFADGVYITKSADQAIIGKQLVSLNSLPIAQVAEQLRPYLPIENEIGFQSYFPYLLSSPLFLAHLGVTESLDSSLSLKFSDNSSIEVSPTTAEMTDILDQIAQTTSIPKYWRPSPSLSIRQEQKDLIVDIRSIRDTTDMTMRQLAEQLDAWLAGKQSRSDDERIERLIVDIRQNGGGNNMLNQKLVHTIIKHDWINYPGKLFVLIDRWTFSAAINLAIALERHTWSIFAGEPFSGRVNHYGDFKEIRLPNSGLSVKISTLYWQDSDPGDKRHSIMPDIPVNLTFEHFFCGKDPVLEAVRSFQLDPVWEEYYHTYTPRYLRFRESQTTSIQQYFAP